MEATVDARRLDRWAAMALFAGCMIADVGAAAPTTAQERRETLFAGAPEWRTRRREELRQWFIDRRNANATSKARDRWRWAALLDAGDPESIERANAGLRDDPIGYGKGSFGLVELLVAEKLYGDRLEKATHDHIRECVTWAMDNPDKGIYGWAKWLLDPEKVEHISGSQCYYAATVGVLAGEVLNDNKLLEAGRLLLKKIVIARSYYGEDAEFNSYNYTAHGLNQMAPLQDLADDPESRLLARWLFARRALVTLSRFHPGSSQVAGPNSRGYASGQLGTGPLNLSLHDCLIPEGVVHDIAVAEKVNGGYTSGRQLRWLSTWDVPGYVLRIGTQKPYPCEVMSTIRDFGWNWKRSDGTRRVLRKGEDDLTTYLTADYALASSADISGYQPSGNHFIAHWPLEEKIDGLDDLRVFWSWYARDDGGPFVKKLVMRRGGIYRTIQHRNKVLALYQPKENITYNAGQVLNTEALALKFVLTAYRPVTGLWIGKQRVSMSQLPVGFREIEPIFLDDGTVYAAVLPLHVTDLGRDAAMRVTYDDQYKLLSVAYYNYRGEKRVFQWDELPRIRNGFAFEIAGKTQYRDFGAFCEHMGEARVTDVVEGNRREATFTSGDTSLLLRYDPVAAGSNTKFLPYQPGDAASIKRQINGKDIDYSHFRSTCAILSTEPKITVGNAMLTRQARVPIWLIQDPASENYAVWNFSGKTISFTLRTPQGQITAHDFHLGRLLVKGGMKPTVEVEQLPGHKARITQEWRK